MVTIKSAVSLFGLDQWVGHRGAAVEVTTGCKATSYLRPMLGKGEVELLFNSNPVIATSTDPVSS